MHHFFHPCCIIHLPPLRWSCLLGAATAPCWMQPSTISKLLTLTSQSSYFLPDVWRPQGLAPAVVAQLSRTDWSSLKTSIVPWRSSHALNMTHFPFVLYASRWVRPRCCWVTVDELNLGTPPWREHTGKAVIFICLYVSIRVRFCRGCKMATVSKDGLVLKWCSMCQFGRFHHLFIYLPRFGAVQMTMVPRWSN